MEVGHHKTDLGILGSKVVAKLNSDDLVIIAWSRFVEVVNECEKRSLLLKLYRYTYILSHIPDSFVNIGFSSFEWPIFNWEPE